MQNRKDEDVHLKPLWKSSFSSTSSEGNSRSKLSLPHGKHSQTVLYALATAAQGCPKFVTLDLSFILTSP